MTEEDYRDYDEGNGSGTGCALGLTLAAIAAVAMGLAALLLGGCARTVYEPVETVRTEYRDNVIERVTVDSVTDTRFVFVKGDTVVDYRDRVKWRDRLVHDSVYIERVDSIPVPYPVERSLSRWERAKMDWGGAAIGGWLGLLCVAVAWLIKKFRR